MILAANTAALDYRGIHPNLDLALEHITPEFLSSLGEERAQLKGEEVYCTKFTYETVPDEEARDRFNDEPTLLEVLSEDGEYEEEPIDIDEAEDVPPQVLHRR